jgi:catechol 2,3-dioxygenase-like lactoylglutathione lyase family enzyme
MLDHASVGARDIERARDFYQAVLTTLDLCIVDEAPGRFVDFGLAGGRPLFSVETPVDGQSASAGNGVHFAFRAPSIAVVEAFHAAGLAHCGTCAGPPGPRPAYGPDYFSAFVLDPEGNKVEAVWYGPIRAG